MSGDLNLPFEPQDPFEAQEAVMLSGGVVVLALVVADRPALGFRFAKADGSGFYPMVVLGCDDPADLLALPRLVADGVTRALECSP